MVLTHTQRGIIAVIGGILTHVILGTVYLWGNIALYIASYLHYYDDPEYNYKGQLSIVFPIMVQTQVFFIPFGVVLANRFGTRKICLIATILQSGAIFACSFTCDNFVGFIMIYGIFTGIPVGILYQVPIVNSFNFFPQKKGLLSGIIVGAFGLGSFIFSWLAMFLINKDHEKTYHTGEHKGYFPKDIADNLPGALQILSAIYLCVMFVGSLLMLQVDHTQKAEYHKSQNIPMFKSQNIHLEVPHDMGIFHNDLEKEDDVPDEEPNHIVVPNSDHDHDHDNEQIDHHADDMPADERDDHQNQKSDHHDDEHHSQQQQDEKIVVIEKLQKKESRNIPIHLQVGLKHKLVYINIYLIFSCSSFGQLIAANFKTIGTSIEALNDDFFLTLVGSLSSIVNFLARIFWGMQLDKYPIRSLLLFNTCLSIIVTATLSLVMESKAGYAIYVFLAFFSFGGIFAMMPVNSARQFGKVIGSQLYGVQFQGFGTSTWFQFICVSFLKPDIGWANVFYIYTATIGASFIVLLLSDFKVNWHALNKKYGMTHGMTSKSVISKEIKLDVDGDAKK